MATATAQPQVAAPARIATLDGWRGIAILLVLFDHAQKTLGGRKWLPFGQHGVTIFFVLSGFLITTKLLEGPIDLKRFYTRRFFRLMPAAWAYLAFVALSDVVFQEHRLSWQHLVSCLLFYRNYSTFHVGNGAAGHFWSLSMEEQFYLVWPVMLFLIGVKRCKWFAIAGIAACAFWRCANWNFYNRFPLNFHTEVRADALLTGCLLAILMSQERGNFFIQCWVKWSLLPAIVGVFYYILLYPSLSPLGEDICIATLIAASVQYPNRALSRWLGVCPLAPLGVVSYSIYVWQQYFFEVRRGPISTPLLMALMPIFAIASYHWIEQPCRRVGYRLTSRHRRNEPARV